jgi:hypothetical protein
MDFIKGLLKVHGKSVIHNANNAGGSCSMEGQSTADATWVEVGAFKKAFPAFQLEDKLDVGEGRDVMTGIKYAQHKGRTTSVQDSTGCRTRSSRQFSF